MVQGWAGWGYVPFEYWIIGKHSPHKFQDFMNKLKESDKLPGEAENEVNFDIIGVVGGDKF